MFRVRFFKVFEDGQRLARAEVTVFEKRYEHLWVACTELFLAMLSDARE
jgi:hypothetical protein